jgi:hypothetical protein
LVDVGVTVEVELMGAHPQGQTKTNPEGQAKGHDVRGQVEVGLGVVIVVVGFGVVKVDDDDDGKVAVTV